MKQRGHGHEMHQSSRATSDQVPNAASIQQDSTSHAAEIVMQKQFVQWYSVEQNDMCDTPRFPE